MEVHKILGAAADEDVEKVVDMISAPPDATPERFCQIDTHGGSTADQR